MLMRLWTLKFWGHSNEEDPSHNGTEGVYRIVGELVPMFGCGEDNPGAPPALAHGPSLLTPLSEQVRGEDIWKWLIRVTFPVPHFHPLIYCQYFALVLNIT